MEPKEDKFTEKLPVNSSYPSPMFRSTVPNTTGPSSAIVSLCKLLYPDSESIQNVKKLFVK